jgi:hypothetical protein
VGLDTVVALVIDGAHVKVALQSMEGLLHGSYHIIEFPDVQFVILVQAGQQHVLAAIISSTTKAQIYDIQGNRHDNVRKGVNIIRMKNGKTKKTVVK